MSNKREVVLSFIDWYRPGYKAGGTITSFGNFVDYMDTKFEFKIVTRDTDYLTTYPYKNIDSDGWNTLGNNQGFYISNKLLNRRFIKGLILSTPHDYVYINGVFSFYFSILPVLITKGDRCILNPHGMLSSQAFSVKSLKKNIFIKFANLLNMYRNVTFHVSNDEEAKAVRKHIKNYKKIVIANQFPRKMQFESLNERVKNNCVRFVNLARISVEKGTLTMIQAASKSKQPLQLDIYGPIYDTAYWELCKRAILTLPRHISVNYKGVLHSDAVLRTLSDYDFFVLLSEGENFGHAILEALSTGLPVLISNQTPWDNLAVQSVGWDVDVNDEAAIISCFETASTMPNVIYYQWSTAAITYAQEFIQNPQLLEQNKTLFLNV